MSDLAAIPAYRTHAVRLWLLAVAAMIFLTLVVGGVTRLTESGLSIDYRQTTAESLAGAQNDFFDIVVCFELLEHVPEPRSVVAACRRLAKPGGDIFFATLNRTIKSFVFAIIGAEYILRLVPRGTHAFRRFVKPSELNDWAEAVGLRLQDLIGLHYNPFVRRYSLGGGVRVNYFAHYKHPNLKGE